MSITMILFTVYTLACIVVSVKLAGNFTNVAWVVHLQALLLPLVLGTKLGVDFHPCYALIWGFVLFALHLFLGKKNKI